MCSHVEIYEKGEFKMRALLLWPCRGLVVRTKVCIKVIGYTMALGFLEKCIVTMHAKCGQLEKQKRW